MSPVLSSPKQVKFDEDVEEAVDHEDAADEANDALRAQLTPAQKKEIAK